MGVIGTDGKRGGRLEREVEAWEGTVRGKRAGYREKVKARQSTGTNGDTTIGTIGEDGDVENEEPEHENKRLRIDNEGSGREGSATGEISQSTQNLKIGGANSDKRIQEQEEDDFGEDDVPDEDSDEQDEDDEEDDEQEQEQDQIETQAADEGLEQGDPSSQRLKHTLAADGRVEDDNSDDDSD